MKTVKIWNDTKTEFREEYYQQYQNEDKKGMIFSNHDEGELFYCASTDDEDELFEALENAEKFLNRLGYYPVENPSDEEIIQEIGYIFKQDIED